MKKICLLFFIGIFSQCSQQESKLAEHSIFIQDVLKNTNSFYHLDYCEPADKKSLAIGIFDSGIGGLTVFDAIIRADYFSSSGVRVSDGISDFINEQFVYLADQANMPYSNYVELGKENLLVEHVFKDAIFLVNTKYHQGSHSEAILNDKPAIKTLVIACNTATAFGKDKLEQIFKETGVSLKIIGVIDAGAMGALDYLEKDESGTIAVFATPATIGSEAYPSNLKRLISERNYTGEIFIIQQGGKGLHESIDNKVQFIDSKLTTVSNQYQGPSLNDSLYKIEKHLLDFYNFDTTNNHLLHNAKYVMNSDTIQLNSIENYVRYHIFSMVERIKNSGSDSPLKAIILGCTHYPYVMNEINMVLGELRGKPEYSAYLADTVYLIDPAINTAIELYSYLSENELFNNQMEERNKQSMFFISVPNAFNPEVNLSEEGGFRYQYQYIDRKINELQEYTLLVPFSKEVISEPQLIQIKKNFPKTYSILKDGIK